MQFDGLAMIIAWPETLCKRAGSWYDFILELSGLSNKGYYKVGHAAIVLIDAVTSKCYYFDFGRYHSPAGYGRVRDAVTDHDLKIKTTAEWDLHGMLLNSDIIEAELRGNESCHGTGKLYVSYCRIDFGKAYMQAKKMQSNSPIQYGPFIPGGTNCSRFVRTVALAGQPAWKEAWRMYLSLVISPMPAWNVKAVGTKFLADSEQGCFKQMSVIKSFNQ